MQPLRREGWQAKLLLSRLVAPAANGQLIFSDKKNFSQDQKINRKFNRWLCSDISEVPIVMATKFPATVIVLGVVSNKGDMMPPTSSPKELMINTEDYVKVLLTWSSRGWTGWQLGAITPFSRMALLPTN
jgi:hypothetical protein